MISNETGTGYLLTGLVTGIALTFIGFKAFPLPLDNVRTYDLVQIDGQESDIIDYDLSATDCGNMQAALQLKGYVVKCERTR